MMPKGGPRAAEGAVLLHVGLHKTGTTWLQTGLFEAPDAGFHAPWPRHEVLERLVLADPLGFDEEATRAWLEDGVARARALGCVPVLSHERLSGNPHSGGYDRKEIADRLRALLPEARILITIREQRSAIVSTYKQYVREGGALGLERYLRPPRRGLARVPMFRFEYFEYDRLIEYYQRHFGAERVLVLPFEELRADPDAFVARLARFAGLAAVPPAPRGRENVALSTPATALKRLLNRFAVRDRLNPSGWLDSERGNSALVRGLELLDGWLPEGVRGAGERRLAARVAERVAGRYRESNQRTSALTGIDLGALGYEV